MIAGIVFATGVVDMVWCVEPTFYPHGIHFGWQEVAALAGIGGVWFYIFSATLGRHPVLPRNDPRIHQEVAHASV